MEEEIEMLKRHCTYLSAAIFYTLEEVADLNWLREWFYGDPICIGQLEKYVKDNKEIL